jgi:hypothetical protein
LTHTPSLPSYVAVKCPFKERPHHRSGTWQLYRNDQANECFQAVHKKFGKIPADSVELTGIHRVNELNKSWLTNYLSRMTQPKKEFDTGYYGLGFAQKKIGDEFNFFMESFLLEFFSTVSGQIHTVIVSQVPARYTKNTQHIKLARCHRFMKNLQNGLLPSDKEDTDVLNRDIAISVGDKTHKISMTQFLKLFDQLRKLEPQVMKVRIQILNSLDFAEDPKTFETSGFRLQMDLLSDIKFSVKTPLYSIDRVSIKARKSTMDALKKLLPTAKKK